MDLFPSTVVKDPAELFFSWVFAMIDTLAKV